MIEDYKDLKKALEAFKEKVSKQYDDIQKNADEIRRCKATIQMLQQQNAERILEGNYIRDDKRIILSAPEIIIGDVAQNGMLNGYSPSRVIIRSNNVCLEGVTTDSGKLGTITQRAPAIENVCVDPGLDGEECTVGPVSRFSVQAGGIGLLSETTPGVFVDTPDTSRGNVNIQADKDVKIKAAVPLQTRKKCIDDLKENRNDWCKQMDTIAQRGKRNVDDALTKLEDLLNNNLFGINENQQVGEDGMQFDEVYAKYNDIIDLNTAIEQTTQQVATALNTYNKAMSRLAELKRQQNCLEKAKEEVEKNQNDFKEANTNASVNIIAENTSIKSLDADDNIRDTAGAGLQVIGREVNFSARKEDSSTMENSKFDICANNIQLSTSTQKNGKEKITVSQTETGTVRICSKNVAIDSVDYETDNEGEKIKETALAMDSTFKIHMQNVNIDSCDTVAGKNAGSFVVNSKDIALCTLDLKLDENQKTTDTHFTDGSKVNIISKQIYAGGIDKDQLSDKVEIGSTKAFDAELQENINLKSKETTITGEKTKVDSEMSVTKEAEFQVDAKVQQNLTVGTSVQCPVVKKS